MRCYQTESNSACILTVPPNTMMLAESKIPDFMTFTTGMEFVPVFKIIIFQTFVSVVISVIMALYFISVNNM